MGHTCEWLKAGAFPVSGLSVPTCHGELGALPVSHVASPWIAVGRRVQMLGVPLGALRGAAGHSPATSCWPRGWRYRVKFLGLVEGGKGGLRAEDTLESLRPVCRASRPAVHRTTAGERQG